MLDLEYWTAFSYESGLLPSSKPENGKKSIIKANYLKVESSYP
jgi:hypothetical protein